MDIFTDDSIPTLRIDQTPTPHSWKLIPLYRLSAYGSFQSWQIGFDFTQSKLIITYGQESQTIQSTEVTTNSSNRTIQQQAFLEARQRYLLKYKSGYRPAEDAEPQVRKAMKGYDYSTGQHKIISWPVSVQPKLNGIRMICYPVKDKLCYKSFGNTSWTHIKHFEDDISEFLSYLPPGSFLDGEIYKHGMPFTGENGISSIVRTNCNGTSVNHPKLTEMEYWIFDFDGYVNGEKLTMEERIKLLTNAYNNYMEDRMSRGVNESTIIVLESWLCNNKNELEEYLDNFIEQGYEGVMIKKLANGAGKDTKQYLQSLYKPDKSNHILKYKRAKDTEGTIIDVFQGKGVQEGCAVFVIKGEGDVVFKSCLKGSLEQRREWYDNKEKLIGKPFTYKYQELTVHGKPMHPVGLGIRDFE